MVRTRENNYFSVRIKLAYLRYFKLYHIINSIILSHVQLQFYQAYGQIFDDAKTSK